jgi:nucleoside-diphosphate-sugar epimerase
MSRKTIVITGAAGGIGTCLRAEFRNDYDLRSVDRVPTPGEKGSVVTDLSDPEILRAAMEGAETVIHLAATPTEAPFVENLVPNNVVGTYNTFEAARLAGVKRIVFASTCQVSTHYPQDRTVRPDDLPNPLSVYGATKHLGEVMGRWYHDKHGIEFIGVRIGWFFKEDAVAERFLRTNRDARRLWLSRGDCARFFRLAVEKPGVGHAVLFATSRTEIEWLSRVEAREVLGYEPRDDATAFPDEVAGG